MRLENVLAVTGGRLLNTPSISRFDDVALYPHRAKRGSLFVARSVEEIDEALKNGAYGIVTDKKVVPTDEEVAWIAVDSLHSTLPKLLRLWLVIYHRVFYALKRPVFEFCKSVASDPNAIFLSDDSLEACEEIFTSKEGSAIFSAEPLFLERIGAKVVDVEPSKIENRVVKGSLFLTSAVIDGLFYEDLHLPASLYPLLLEALGTLEKLDLAYSLAKLDFIPSFKPVFVDARLQEVPFGESDRVLLFISGNLPPKCYEDLEKIKWTEAKIFIPTQIKLVYDIKLPTIKYESETELLEILEKEAKRPGYLIFFEKKSDSLFNTLYRFRDEESSQSNKGLF